MIDCALHQDVAPEAVNEPQKIVETSKETPATVPEVTAECNIQDPSHPENQETPEPVAVVPEAVTAVVQEEEPAAEQQGAAQQDMQQEKEEEDAEQQVQKDVQREKEEEEDAEQQERHQVRSREKEASEDDEEVDYEEDEEEEQEGQKDAEQEKEKKEVGAESVPSESHEEAQPGKGDAKSELFVRNLAAHSISKDLRQYLSGFGSVTNCYFHVMRFSSGKQGQSQRVGATVALVSMASEADAQAVIKACHKKDFDGACIIVETCDERKLTDLPEHREMTTKKNRGEMRRWAVIINRELIDKRKARQRGGAWGSCLNRDPQMHSLGCTEAWGAHRSVECSGGADIPH